jgi:hypothetical protein
LAFQVYRGCSRGALQRLNLAVCPSAACSQNSFAPWWFAISQSGCLSYGSQLAKQLCVVAIRPRLLCFSLRVGYCSAAFRLA